MNPIGPNGYNFSNMIPSEYTGTVQYIFNSRRESPTGYFGVGGYIILYGHIAGCPSTGPTGPAYVNGMSGHPGPAGPPNQRMF